MQPDFKFTPRQLAIPLALVFMLWLVYWIDLRFATHFRDYGLNPKTVAGLRGVITMPLLHGSISHLFNNSVPMFVLSLALIYFYRRLFWPVLLAGWLGSGLLTWFIATSGNHIGASGLVYYLVAFLITAGVLSRYYRLVAISFAVLFVYGSFIWGVLPTQERISWEGHLSGMILGIVAAFLVRGSYRFRESYTWEKPDFLPHEDDFMLQFDEHGKFSPLPPEISEEDEDANDHEPDQNVVLAPEWVRDNTAGKEEE